MTRRLPFDQNIKSRRRKNLADNAETTEKKKKKKKKHVSPSKDYPSTLLRERIPHIHLSPISGLPVPKTPSPLFMIGLNE